MNHANLGHSVEFDSGQMVHMIAFGASINGIVSDPWVKVSGANKGKLGVVFVGNQYGESFVEPSELREGWVLHV